MIGISMSESTNDLTSGQRVPRRTEREMLGLAKQRLIRLRRELQEYVLDVHEHAQMCDNAPTVIAEAMQELWGIHLMANTSGSLMQDDELLDESKDDVEEGGGETRYIEATPGPPIQSLTSRESSQQATEPGLIPMPQIHQHQPRNTDGGSEMYSEDLDQQMDIKNVLPLEALQHAFNQNPSLPSTTNTSSQPPSMVNSTTGQIMSAGSLQPLMTDPFTAMISASQPPQQQEHQQQQFNQNSQQPGTSTSAASWTNQMDSTSYAGYQPPNAAGGKNEMRFACSQCDARFNFEWYLKRHVLAVHGAGPPILKCRFCDFRSHYQGSLVRHERVKHNLQTVPRPTTKKGKKKSSVARAAAIAAAAQAAKAAAANKNQ